MSPWDVFPLGHFVPLDVLSKGTFSPLGRLVPWDVLSLGTFGPLGRFVPWEVFSMGRLSLGRLVLGRFVCASLSTQPLHHGRISSLLILNIGAAYCVHQPRDE